MLNMRSNSYDNQGWGKWNNNLNYQFIKVKNISYYKLVSCKWYHHHGD